ncbi:glycine betaine ABC transporter substrate-binding protein [Blastococcus sp. SYSU DS0552]
MRTHALRLAAGLAALSLTATACGGDEGSDPSASGAGGTCESVTLGFIPSWTDTLSTSYLWQDVLEHHGYEVEFAEISDAALLYTGVAEGDIDVYSSAWPEVTHAAYMEQYGDQIEDLGTWYEGATNTLAVPDYTDADSIADLAENPDAFDGRIVGIEPGAGLTKVTKDSVMPAYGLGDAGFELVESSTVAMLAELEAAIEAQEDVVVTLWHPFWAYSQFPLKDLEDPEGAFGEPEAIHTLARGGFGSDCGEVAELMGQLQLSDEQYASLEDTVVNEYGEGQYAESVEAWLEANPDVAETLKS